MNNIIWIVLKTVKDTGRFIGHSAYNSYYEAETHRNELRDLPWNKDNRIEIKELNIR